MVWLIENKCLKSKITNEAEINANSIKIKSTSKKYTTYINTFNNKQLF